MKSTVKRLIIITLIKAVIELGKHLIDWFSDDDVLVEQKEVN